MTVVRETIAVKGEAERDGRAALHAARPGAVHRTRSGNRAFALKWVGSEPGGAAYLASLAVGRARNQDEFLDALEAWKVPGLNFVYADVDGNIGWVAAARTPVRRSTTACCRCRATAASSGRATCRSRDLPQSFNPPDGWLATANHNILPDGYPHQIGYEFAPPYRFQRIRERLDVEGEVDARRLPRDPARRHVAAGLALAQLLEERRSARTRTSSRTRSCCAEWDGRLSVDSQAGPLYAVWLRELQQQFYAPARAEGAA